jgi:hypothetical protein
MASHTEPTGGTEPELSNVLQHYDETPEAPVVTSELDHQVDAAVRDVESWFVHGIEPRSSSVKGASGIDWSIPHLVEPIAEENEREIDDVEAEPVYQDHAASVEERRIDDSVRAVERRMMEIADARQQVENRLLIKLETEAKLQVEVTARRKEEEDLRRQAAEDAAQRRREDEQKLAAQRQEVLRTERELKSTWDAERRLRAEVLRLKQSAHEALLKRVREEEDAKLALLAEAQRSRNEAEEIHVDSLAKLHTEEEYLRRAAARFSLRRTEVEAQRQTHESELRKLEEERSRVAMAVAARLAERKRVREEAEEKLRLEQEYLLSQENELTRLTEALSQQRVELERARQNAEEDARRLAEARARMEAAQERSQQAERERFALEAEIFERAEIERRMLDETRSRAEEQRQQLEASARERSLRQTQQVAELESVRVGVAASVQVNLEKESTIKQELEALQQAEQVTINRIAELEAQCRAASESHSRMLEKLSRVEEEINTRATHEAETRAEIEQRIKEETEQLKRIESEHQQRIDEEIARRLEAERRAVQEKNRYQAERDARIKAELRVDLSTLSDATLSDAIPRERVEYAETETLTRGVESTTSDHFYSEILVDQPDGSVSRVYQVGDLSSADPRRRADAVTALSRLGANDAYDLIVDCFDDEESLVRNAAARAMMTLEPVHPAESFTRALKDASEERQKRIGKAIAESGLATQALTDLCSQDREETYNGLCLLFTMARTGEVEPLVNAIESHEDAEVRLAAIRLLQMSGQEVLATEAVNRRLKPNRNI